MTTKSKVYVALVILVLVFGSAVLWHNRLSSDFWPLDASRVGPNLVASLIQGALVFLAAVLLYPPFRKAMEHIAEQANAELHEKIERNAKLLKHVIKHSPDIPNHDHTGTPLVEEHHND